MMTVKYEPSSTNISESRTEMFKEMAKRIVDKMRNHDDMMLAISDLWKRMNADESDFYMGIHEESYTICTSLEGEIDSAYTYDADWYLLYNKTGVVYQIKLDYVISPECIREEIEDATNDIIGKWQDRLSITSGDVEPYLDVLFEETKDKLRDVIVSILQFQETWCKD